MAGNINFNRNYVAFGAQVRPFEKADDVGIVVSELLWFEGWPFYPVGALIEAKISSAWLGEGEQPGNEDNLDLIFKMRPVDGAGYFEIILRTAEGPVYGGYAWGTALDVTDEIVNGHRVLVSTADGAELRYEYRFDAPDGRPQYMQADFRSLRGSSALAVRSSRKVRR